MEIFRKLGTQIRWW